MIYLVITMFVLWLASSIYFIKHILLLNKELDELNNEQHQQNMDIIHLMKMDVEIANTVDTHTTVMKQMVPAVEHLLDLSDKKFLKKTKTNIFNSPQGEA